MNASQDCGRSVHSRRPSRKLALSLAALALFQIDHEAAFANDASTLERPTIKTDRSQEDWSFLADPKLRTQPLDGFKYIPLFSSNRDSYISLGLNLREIFEVSDAPAFGTVPANPADSYWLQRAQFHIDVHLNENWQLFTQFEDVRAFDKTVVGPNDANRFDLRLAFIGYTQETDAGTFRARIGRQDFAFDLERFVSLRDGPNVRQSFDAIWAGWETEAWRFYGLVSQPVENRDDDPFDDRSSGDVLFSGARIEWQLSQDIEASTYYALYQRKDAAFLAASGEEDRHMLNIRTAGKYAGFDWDVEAMGQVGKVGSADVLAWAVGARTGYTFQNIGWSPRIGLQFDMASGDRDADDGRLGTFNPLFPNGFYFSLGGHTGYANLVHLKPSITVQPSEDLTLMAGAGLLWRLTTDDAVYTMPSVPVAGTAAGGSPWTGAYAQVRADYRFNQNLTGSVEAVHYRVGSTLRDAGGRDSNYFRAELKFAW
ncbi:alginate export family protein [Phyllobacterium sp. 0TCS1.6C]|uniref:alginate export family protein n=1 Tax=unclassified Phyllobacterium TaxID=2638441 RepID=UPI002263E1FD|nr:MULTISPECIES: alginate export family protein [unclassified Phyllobacterium]MCX8282514.1 alginate export family protein [Phyllobacterium sp. 0TCS1.6C]MCX8296432.1 alginate export family protein [Phyllobacterium sp. 0TCS1.6A]